MKYVVIFAGLPELAFDRLKRISEKDLAPAGKVIARPNMTTGSYTATHAQQLAHSAREYLISIPENEPVSLSLIYINYHDKSTNDLLEIFFPSCLCYELKPFQFDSSSSKRLINEHLNRFSEIALKAASLLRAKARSISEVTSVANLTPLLLPIRNFQSSELRTLLTNVLNNACEAENPAQLARDSVKRFLSAHPLVYPEDNGRTKQHHCFSDGKMYFKSPGKDRHGYLRNSQAHEHSAECVLNARSRLGGTFAHNFHYDCTPCKGKLAPGYMNCHQEITAPKPTHVNIAPNDFILS